MRILVGIVLGGIAGGVLAWKGRHIEAVGLIFRTPYAGLILGGMVGALVAFAMPARRRAEEDGTAPAVIDIGAEEQFEETVLASPVPVLVDFWAPWCGPCRIQGPVLGELAAELGDRARIVKVNVERLPGLSRRYRISAIPTLLVFSRGRPRKRLVGLQSKDRLREVLTA